MRIGSRKSKSKFSWFPIVLVALLALVFLYNYSEEQTVQAVSQFDGIYCGAENPDGESYSNQGRMFYGGQLQASERHFKGKHSMRLDKNNLYGFTTELKDLQPGDQLLLSVWTYKTSGDRGFLALAAENIDEYYIDESAPSKVLDNGWQKISVVATIPEKFESKLFKAYVFLKENSGPVYFDEFKIEAFTGQKPSENMEGLALRINIDDKDYQKLNTKKWDAVSKGNLFVKDDDWVPAEIGTPEGNNLKAKIRLKGDWLDHLKGNKWSFRIKLSGENTWRGMRVFSVQSSHTRSHLLEWFYHEWMKREDVLCPRYEFLEIFLGEKSLGCYVYEEHFTKHLVENQSRREGPIIKFTEDAMWQGARKGRDFLDANLINEQAADAFKIAQIVPFNEKKTMESPVLKAQFEEARDLLSAYKHHKANTEDVFEMERLAKWYAMVDVLGAEHSQAWHNLRFYYNPVISKLEPIGFDGFGENHIINPSTPFMGYHFNVVHKEEEIARRPLLDPQFMRLYVRYLNQFSDPEYLIKLFGHLRGEITLRQQFINTEYPNYSLNENQILKNARHIQAYLLPLEANAVQAFKLGDSITILNAHCLPVEVVGYKVKQSVELNPIEQKKTIMSSGINQEPASAKMAVPQGAKQIVYTVLGIDSTFAVNIYPGKRPESIIGNSNLRNGDIEKLDQYGSLKGKLFRFNRGNHIVSKDLVIPKNLEIVIDSKSEFDVINGASIISYSPISIQGTKENPVKFYSSDSSAGGITILQSGGRSNLKYVSFEDFNTLQKGNWNLTGAVTFYESPVTLDHLEISNNKCEDALNIIRSPFEVNHLTLNNTAFDGFDADFCEGTVTESTFYEIGNDAMDFSGSKINIHTSYIDNVGDKGISVGENSKVLIKDVVIKNANIGIASKDFSVAEFQNGEIIDCNTGFAAYQKKPEFGPAKIFVDDLITFSAKFPQLIEDGSLLTINGKKTD